MASDTIENNTIEIETPTESYEQQPAADSLLLHYANRKGVVSSADPLEMPDVSPSTPAVEIPSDDLGLIAYRGALGQLDANSGIMSEPVHKTYQSIDGQTAEVAIVPTIPDLGEAETAFTVADLLTRQHQIIMQQQAIIDSQKYKLKEYEDAAKIAEHDTKQPLTSALIHAQLIGRSLVNDTLPEAAKRERIAKSAGTIVHELQIINEGLASILSGETRPSKFEFESIIGDALEFTQTRYPSHRFIKQGDDMLAVYADKAQLRRVLGNLLNNAAKYSPANSQILVVTSSDEKNIYCSVQDHGIGIAPEHLPRLFEKEYRVKDVADSYEGKGLGLYAVANIIKQHGGKISVESQVNQGTTMTISLPR